MTETHTSTLHAAALNSQEVERPAGQTALQFHESTADRGEDRAETPSWQEFVREIVDCVEGAAWAGWRIAGTAKGQVPTADTANTPQEGCGTSLHESTDYPASAEIDDLMEFQSDLADVRRPATQPAVGTNSVWRTKTSTLLAAVRIARTFCNSDGLIQALGNHDAIVMLTTGSTGLDEIIEKTLQVMVADDDIWPASISKPLIILAPDIPKSSGFKMHRPFPWMGDETREAIERAKPIIMVTPIAGAAPKAVFDLRPRTIQLAPLDCDMLKVMLTMAYPDNMADSENLGIAEGLMPSRLTVDQLTLAMRAGTPKEAVQAIVKVLAPPQDATFGLAEFPLPETVRQPIEQLLADLRDWKSGELQWKDVSRGPIIVGPPGSGKTELARIIGREAGVSVVAGSVAQWSAEGARGSEVIKAMRATFARAAEQAPALLFIDELDSFGNRERPQDQNSSWTDYIVGALLDLLDGFHGHEGVLVMAATNHLAKIDKAIARPGRFDRILTLGYPDHTLLPQALRWHLGSDLPTADLSETARQAMGMSGADIASAVRAARAIARNARRSLILEDLTTTIAEIRPPLSHALLKIVAVHEAGHAIASVSTGRATLKSVEICGSGGVTKASISRDRQDRAALEEELVIDLSGRAAEALIFGRVSAGAGGAPDSDLARATQLATAIEASWGLGDTLIWHGPETGVVTSLRYNPALQRSVEAHLRRAEARALRIMEKNRDVLNRLAEALMDARILTETELAVFAGQVVMDDVSSLELPCSDSPKVRVA